MKSLAVLCLGLFTSFTVKAATVAIIDSGMDYKHPQLKYNLWVNPAMKFAGPYALAVNGWNFAENNNQIFDHSLLNAFSPDVKKYVEITSKAFLFSATEVEKAWAMAKEKEAGFSPEVNRFSTYVHGTHVAGIASKGTKHKLMGIKLLPTPAKVVIKEVQQELRLKGLAPEEPEKVLSFVLVRLAIQNATRMKEITTFVGNSGAEVANGSFGMGIPLAASIVNSAFQSVFKRVPTAEELAKFTLMFMNTSIVAGAEYVKAAPNTLFVFAAGNDGLSNDTLGATPANIKAPNTITVAATYNDLFFAPFSNYGTKMVEVAAPGMIINSSIPGDDYLSVSGTSQAAPLVARIAGLVKDANSALTPAQIKQIIMGTVDKKEFLKLRVASGGIVNQERAVFAAVMTKVVKMDEAIERSFFAVPVKKFKSKGMTVLPKNIKPIPLAPLFE